MDLDGDGTQDVITGSWPGELYLFKGAKSEKGPCTYAEPVQLKDKDGNVINTGKASALFASDWDRDGDLDLVVGSIDGWVWLVPNESGDKKLTFGTPVKIEVDGKPIHEHHSGPTIADWDGNGTLDLIVGQGDGNVVWYSNASRAGAPKLAAPEVLHKGAKRGRSDGSHCGGRVKPHVVDWNGDGRLDLLLGDFAVKPPEKKELTEEQAKELAELEAQQKALMQKMSPIYEAATRAALESLGVEVPDDRLALGALFAKLTDEQKKAYAEAMQKALKESEDLKALQAENKALFEKMVPLKGRMTVLGHVWLLARKAPEMSSEETGATGTQD